MLAGIAVSIVLVAGWQFSPLTATRKLVAVTLAAMLVAAFLDLRTLSWKSLWPILAGAAVACGIWLVWPVLKRREGLDLLLLLAVAGAYPAWITASLDSLHGRTDQALGALLALGMGTGVGAMLGASALLGQLGLAAAAAVGAGALVHFIGVRQHAGRVWTLPVSLSLGLLGASAVVYAKLPREALLLLALVPLAAHIPLPGRTPDWLRLALITIFCLVPAGAAIVFTWRVAGGIPL